MEDVKRRPIHRYVILILFNSMVLRDHLAKSEIHAGVRYFKGQIFENPSNKKVSHLFKNVVLQIQISNACRGIYI